MINISLYLLGQLKALSYRSNCIRNADRHFNSGLATNQPHVFQVRKAK